MCSRLWASVLGSYFAVVVVVVEVDSGRDNLHTAICLDRDQLVVVRLCLAVSMRRSGSSLLLEAYRAGEPFRVMNNFIYTLVIPS